mmetsp:Transcript_12802/g.47313  ORF Transcript_12802/g.47313 Transcript_12802/m.47313 type:complete len:248 (+) Transcript_12802:694-1437(+)
MNPEQGKLLYQASVPSEHEQESTIHTGPRSLPGLVRCSRFHSRPSTRRRHLLSAAQRRSCPHRDRLVRGSCPHRPPPAPGWRSGIPSLGPHTTAPAAKTPGPPALPGDHSRGSLRSRTGGSRLGRSCPARTPHSCCRFPESTFGCPRVDRHGRIHYCSPAGTLDLRSFRIRCRSHHRSRLPRRRRHLVRTEDSPLGRLVLRSPHHRHRSRRVRTVDTLHGTGRAVRSCPASAPHASPPRPSPRWCVS